MVNVQEQSAIERFERRFVFRVGRGYFFVVAVIAFLGLIGGAVYLGSGFVKKSIPEPVAPPEIPKPAPITASDIDKLIAELNMVEPNEGEEDEGAYRDSAQGGQRGPAAPDEMTRLLNDFRGLFPAPQYSWDDVYRTVCTYSIPGYGCVSRDQRLEQEGISKKIFAVLNNGTKDRNIALLRILNAILPAIAVEKRLSYLIPAATLLDRRDTEYQQKVSERESKIQEDRQKYEEQVNEDTTNRKGRQKWGLYATAGGLALLVLVSVFLAFFAMERHLRMMREIVFMMQNGNDADDYEA